MPGHAAHQSTNNVGRSAPRDALGVPQLREVPALRGACLRGGSHPVGSEHIERQTAAVRAVHGVRPQGRDHSAPGMGRCRYWLPAISGECGARQLRGASVVSELGHTFRVIRIRGDCPIDGRISLCLDELANMVAPMLRALPS
jgi:hypothetical protein